MAPADDDKATTDEGLRTARTSVSRLTSERYRLGNEIGHGGMGEIIAARDEQIGREVAIKRMRSAQPNEAAVERFTREAQIQGRLEHPAIVPVHELGRDTDGLPFFAMKKVTGTTLGKILELKTMPRQPLLRAFTDVCLAVEFAHVNGVVHRDLKPDNIMLGDFGEVYVLDWGVAKILGESEPVFDGPISDHDLTAAGAIVGTPAFMAPEQARATHDIDARADVYSLGRVLEEILDTDPAPELASVAAKATELDRDARLATARELGEAVQRYLDGDRDLALRRKLAEEHLARARSTFASGDHEQARSVAMREAGRALALDPQLEGAADLVTRMMLEPPATPPAEVERAVDAESTAKLRQTVRGFLVAQLSYLGVVPSLIVAHSLMLCAIMATTVLTNVLVSVHCIRTGQFPKPWIIAALNIGELFVLARLFSPVFATPVVAALFITTLAQNPLVKKRSSIWFAMALTLLALVGLVLLERAGVLPATMTMSHGLIAIHAPGIAFDPSAGLILILVFFVAAMVVATRLGENQRLSNHRAQLQIHTQAWHLQQLVSQRK